MGVVAPFARFAALQLLAVCAWHGGAVARPERRQAFDVLDYVDPLIGTAAGGKQRVFGRGR
jgi:hypothetical protein